MTASQPAQPPEGGQSPPGVEQPLGQGQDPSAHDRPAPGQEHGEPGPGRPPFGHHQYGPPAYSQPGYGHQPFPPPGYGQPPDGPAPYGYAPYGHAPYGQQYGQAPHGQQSYGQVPYGQVPYGPPGYPGGRPAGGGAEFSVDLTRLARDDYAVAGGTVLFLLFGLLPWWRFGDATFGVSFSGFDDGMVVSAFVLFLLAAGWALLPGFVRTSLTFPRSSVTVALAGLGLVLTLFAWLDTLRYAFSFWALLAFLTAVVITVVPALALRRELRDRPPRPGPPQPGGYWPGVGAPGQPYPYAVQQPGPPYAPGPGPFPPQPGQGHPGPAAAQHGYALTPTPWQIPPRPPEPEPGITDSERPRTDT